MIIGIGTDIVQIARIQATRQQFGEKFVQRILTTAEYTKFSYLSTHQQDAWLAKRYAAKEAFVKALGCGIGQFATWHEIEVLNNEQGAPVITLSGKTADTLATKATHTKIHISLSDDLQATAFVVIECI